MSNLRRFPAHSAKPAGALPAATTGSPLPFDPAMPPALRGRLLTESLPSPLRGLLAAGRASRRSRFTDDGFTDVVEDWSPPPEVTPEHAALARQALAEIDGIILAPAPANHLLGRVLALLSHYPAKATTPEVEQLLAMDWADDLGEFPWWAVDHAARVWRRTRKWRPSIAEIRGLCADACAIERGLAERLRAIAAAAERGGNDTADGSAAGGRATVRPLLETAVRRMR